VPIVLKFGSLNLLEPSGPLQEFNEIALPLPLMIHVPYTRYFVLHKGKSLDVTLARVSRGYFKRGTIFVGFISYIFSIIWKIKHI
jgi:hypothetical protein